MSRHEALRRIPDLILDAHPDVPWRLKRGVRNAVVHEYFGGGPSILWETVRGDLPPLIAELDDVLQS